MDYKNKYEQALERARIWKDKSGMPKDKQGILDDIFPELKESEDEKIRKAIIEHFSRGKEVEFPELEEKYNTWIAWLEKQGEPTEINPSEFDSQLNRLLKQFESLPKEELVSSLSFYLNVIQNDGTYKEEKQGEQEPADKVETFKDKLLELFQRFRWKGTPTNGDIIEYVDAHIQELIDTVQKPDSWSEEDEEMCQETIDWFEKKCFPYALESENPARESIKWLKSLRPQSTWKPSDEQIEALHDAIIYVKDSMFPSKNVLKKLYRQLKKLKEE